MGNLILSWINHVRDPAAVLSASVAAGNMPVQNLADPRVGKRWRSLDMNAWGQGTLPGDEEAGVFALRFPRDTPLAGGTVRHLLDASAELGGSGALHDSGAVPLGLAPGHGYHVYMPGEEVTFRNWRFQYGASGVAALDTGLAWAGPVWSPRINYSYDPADWWEDLSTGSEGARSGADWWDEGPRRRRVAFALERLDAEEAEAMMDLSRLAGVSRQVLAILDPENKPRKTIIGTLTESSPVRHPQFGVHTKVFEIKESL
ncbi:hypothetical protein [Parvibaculum sp.]|uniref:hypothetical protein n=1 Tax=Parvibaculum sp. TaxID=2024848 RepID=UPI001E194529|nr:hypothetical protein [Parvibaculum sp.]MBX3490913.1 hypothetical protein [Parvibaculum sp.]